MKLRLSLTVALVTTTFVQEALAGKKKEAVLRGGDKGKGGSDKGKVKGKGKGDDKDKDKDSDRDKGENSGMKQELTGRVIVSRKSKEKLNKAGKMPNQIDIIRAQGLSKIHKHKVVFESSGEDDFQVIEVGVGKEEEFMRELESGEFAEMFEYAQPDYMEYPIETTPNDSLLGNQYHHDLMQSLKAWDISVGSEDITIGICDTGLQLNHPDLSANRLEGYHAPSQRWESDGGDVSDVHPHGTMCAGCAAAIGNNGNGVSGVGWNFKHRPGRVTDASGGGASSAALADCARKMCEKPDVKVVSVSYSGVEGSARRTAATYCKTQGALMVNAAGNDARDLSQFGEADADDLIVVGASDSNDNKSGFSAFGRFVDVWAPGSSVWTTTTGSSYAAVSGTSFSCPLTAGLIALIWSVNPELTPDQVEVILKTSTDNVGIQDPWNTMYGRINSFKAAEGALSGSMPPTSRPTTAPPTTAAPTNIPTTAPPTMATMPTIEAVRDAATSGVPRCFDIGGGCTSGTLLDSRGNVSGGGEDNSPNTIDGCADGNSGSYHSDESVDKIEVIAASGGLLQIGRMAIVRATVWAWNTGSADFADFYVTDGDSSPIWREIGIDKQPSRGGEQVIESEPFELTSTLQTARVRFRWQGAADSCTLGSYNDIDDLIFAVASDAPPPSKNPTTANPTNNPTTGLPTTPPPTNEPTNMPTNAPTNVPTNNPTLNPTNVPTSKPTTSVPTKVPTSNPSLSLVPTEFVSDIFELSSPASGDSFVVGALYFEVQSGGVLSKITDLMVTTHDTKHLQVYSKLGEASPYESTPCAWKLVAETAPGWEGGVNQKVYPTWNSRGFTPVILPTNGVVSFYVVKMGTGEGILGAYRDAPWSTWATAPDSSPVGAVIMTDGKKGYANSPFRPYPETYSAYGLYGGGIKLETMQPGTTIAPSLAPTAPYQSGNVLQSTMESDIDEEVNGLQFDITNDGLETAIIKKFDVLFATAGTHHVEVWMRQGGHQGSSNGCDNHNNWCGLWTQLVNTEVTSTGGETLTSVSLPCDSPASVFTGTYSFAIVSGTSAFLTKDDTTGVVGDGMLTLGRATPIQDYYANNVQTIKAINTPSKLFHGAVHYDIANSNCAVLSQACWVVLDPNASSPQFNGDDGSSAPMEVEIVVRGDAKIFE